MSELRARKGVLGPRARVHDPDGGAHGRSPSCLKWSEIDVLFKGFGQSWLGGRMKAGVRAPHPAV